MRTGERHRPRHIELITRERWGARPPHPDLGSWHVYHQDFWRDRLCAIAVHHAGNSSSNRDIRVVQAAHMNRPGRSKNADIGYHFAIDLRGRIYEGRPIGVKGAHLYRFNTGIVGVVLLADLDRQLVDFDDDVTVAMRAGIVSLIDELRTDYPGIRALGGHREFPYNSERSCPGDLGTKLVADLRAQTALGVPTLENCAADIPYIPR